LPKSGIIFNRNRSEWVKLFKFWSQEAGEGGYGVSTGGCLQEQVRERLAG